MRMVLSHASILELQAKLMKGMRNNRVIPHKRGEWKKLLNVFLQSLLMKDASKKASMDTDSAALERNSETIMRRMV